MGAGNANDSPSRRDNLQSNRELTVHPVSLGLGAGCGLRQEARGCPCQSGAGAAPPALGHLSSHQPPERELRASQTSGPAPPRPAGQPARPARPGQAGTKVEEHRALIKIYLEQIGGEDASQSLL